MLDMNRLLASLLYKVKFQEFLVNVCERFQMVGGLMDYRIAGYIRVKRKIF